MSVSDEDVQPYSRISFFQIESHVRDGTVVLRTAIHVSKTNAAF